MFGNAFKRILVSLMVLALLLGLGAGVLFGVIPALHYDVWRAEPDEQIASPDVSLTTASPEATPTAEPTPTQEPSPVTAEEWVTAYMKTMTTQEKLGQLVMFGFSGTSEVQNPFRDIWGSYSVGNAILYGPNIKSSNSDGGFAQAKKLTEQIASRVNSDIPPLIGIDVEGGSVVRFRWNPQPVSARSLGRRRDADYARQQFETIGSKLVSVGINIDLAPVLDVSENPMDTFLETRIISEDASIAAAIGSSIIEGLQAGGCLSCAKHFPGHGGTNEDSHEVTPVVEKTLEELKSYDLVPFASAIESGVDAIMTSHVLYPALDSTDIASMSKPILTDLLRGEMGFDGIIISDDFRMDGLTTRYEVGDAAVRFLLAGGDIILCGAVSEKQQAIVDALNSAAADGRLTQARIDESVRRVLLQKLALGTWDIQAALAARTTPAP
ncbi:MAG TPA: glycoside hydrolase family 3 N-terminal domain-containing protein [Clostridia bacterium]|nr:glycoside hydrolase family 3 N-terminal domain-containing protein [Clostridia bacterium]